MSRHRPWTWGQRVDEERARVGDGSRMVGWEPTGAAFNIPCTDPGFTHLVRAYSDTRVYFTVIYDGGIDEWIASLPRSPNSGAPVEEIGK